MIEDEMLLTSDGFYFVMLQLHISFNSYQLKGGKMHSIRVYQDWDPIGCTKKLTEAGG